MNPLNNPLSGIGAAKALSGGGSSSSDNRGYDGSRMAAIPGMWGAIGRRARINAQPSTQVATAGPPLGRS